MKLLTVRRMGDEVQGVEIHGDPKRQPEPTHFRVLLPFGDVDIARCSSGEYWIHVRVNRPESGMHLPGKPTGRIVDARADAHDKHASEVDAGFLGEPQLYHLAVKLAEDPS